MNLILNPMDASDPFTFLALKRGVLQYVQIKPILAVITVVCKAAGVYEDGKIAVNNGYTWVAAVYNFSVFLSLYCLVMFWTCLSTDMKPFRPTSKFLTVKGLVFLTFWQGLAISILVAIGWLKSVGPVGDPEYLSLAVQDMLICLEMPIFALLHQYAFSYKDYIDPFSTQQARLPVLYAARDAIGMYDVWNDSLTTIRGTGYGYQTFEPSEGAVHAELARRRRYKAGLRYAEGGKVKYWLPQRTGDVLEIPGERHRGPLTRFRRFLNQRRLESMGYAPLLPEEAAEVVHTASEEESDEGLDLEEGGEAGTDAGQHDETRLQAAERRRARLMRQARAGARSALHFVDDVMVPEVDEDSPASLEFESPDEEEQALYRKSREMLRGGMGDWSYPAVDPAKDKRRRAEVEAQRAERDRQKAVKSRRDEAARERERQRQSAATESEPEEEEEDAQNKSKAKQKKRKGKKGKWLSSQFAAYNEEGESSKPDGDAKPKPDALAPPARSSTDSETPSSPMSPSDGAVDLFVEDRDAEERERVRERRRGDPALRATERKRIFRKVWDPEQQRALVTPDQLAEHGLQAGAEEQDEEEQQQQQRDEHATAAADAQGQDGRSNKREQAMAARRAQPQILDPIFQPLPELERSESKDSEATHSSDGEDAQEQQQQQPKQGEDEATARSTAIAAEAASRAPEGDAGKRLYSRVNAQADRQDLAEHAGAQSAKVGVEVRTSERIEEEGAGEVHQVAKEAGKGKGKGRAYRGRKH